VPIALPLIDEPVVDLLQLQASLFNKLGFIIFLCQQNASMTLNFICFFANF
jgi:hypothetical protein